jgi:hypothetical protein
MAAFEDKQVMVTLCTLSYLAIPDSASGSVKDAETWMFVALVKALRQKGIATDGKWNPVWVGITEDQANLAFLVQNAAEDKLALVVRGTLFEASCAGLENLRQDSGVDVIDKIILGGWNVSVAKGSNDAFEALRSAQFEVESLTLSGATLMEAIVMLAGSGSPTLYVTGHSLGGCVGTMLGLYVQHVLPRCVTQVYTFAAPTAGLADFATAFDGKFDGSDASTNSSWRYVNVWDVVPQAWQTLKAIVDDNWYASPGPARDWSGFVYLFLETAMALPAGKYVQPSANVMALNNKAAYGKSPTLWDANSTDATVEAFIDQVYFQHSLVTAYMPLVKAPKLPLQETVPARLATAEPATADCLTIAELGFVHRLALPAPSAGELAT